MKTARPAPSASDADLPAKKVRRLDEEMGRLKERAQALDKERDRVARAMDYTKVALEKAQSKGHITVPWTVFEYVAMRSLRCWAPRSLTDREVYCCCERDAAYSVEYDDGDDDDHIISACENCVESASQRAIVLINAFENIVSDKECIPDEKLGDPRALQAAMDAYLVRVQPCKFEQPLAAVLRIAARALAAGQPIPAFPPNLPSYW